LSGGGIFDCILAVTAKENGIKEIYTENLEDFKFYNFLKASNPLA
jgi:predicted nucleic acid-binding protein